MLELARLDRSLPLAASLATNNYDSKNARLRLAKTTVKPRKTTQSFGTLIAFRTFTALVVENLEKLLQTQARTARKLRTAGRTDVCDLVFRSGGLSLEEPFADDPMDACDRRAS